MSKWDKKRKRQSKKKSPALDPALLYQWILFLRRDWHGYIIKHATEVEADFSEIRNGS